MGCSQSKQADSVQSSPKKEEAAQPAAAAAPAEAPAAASAEVTAPKKRVIAVIGATGTQGGGLVRAILADKSSDFTVRAITRDANSDKAKALAAQGVEVVTANIDDEASLVAAFTGAYGAFLVTNFWETMSAEKETAQARNLATATKAAGVQHVIWSSLEDTRLFIPLTDDRMPTLHEKYKVPHFDSKGEADKIFAELGVPTTILLTSFYWDNIINFGMGPKKGDDGNYTITFPSGDSKLPGIATEDIGKCAYGVFKRSDLIGKTVGIAGEHPTVQQMADTLSKVLEQNVAYNAVPPSVYSTFYPGAGEMANMFQFKADFNEAFCGARDVVRSKELNPELLTFEQWVEANKAKIQL